MTVQQRVVTVKSESRPRGVSAGELLSAGRAASALASDRSWRERLMTTVEVADMLQIPVETLYAWRQRREGPAGYRVGRHIRYRRPVVEAWLETRADQP